MKLFSPLPDKNLPINLFSKHAVKKSSHYKVNQKYKSSAEDIPGNLFLFSSSR